MKTYKRTETQEKIFQGMKLVHERLIEFKKRIKGELVVHDGTKIVWIKFD